MTRVLVDAKIRDVSNLTSHLSIKKIIKQVNICPSLDCLYGESCSTWGSNTCNCEWPFQCNMDKCTCRYSQEYNVYTGQCTDKSKFHFVLQYIITLDEIINCQLVNLSLLQNQVV